MVNLKSNYMSPVSLFSICISRLFIYLLRFSRGAQARALNKCVCVCVGRRILQNQSLCWHIVVAKCVATAYGMMSVCAENRINLSRFCCCSRFSARQRASRYMNCHCASQPAKLYLFCDVVLFAGCFASLVIICVKMDEVNARVLICNRL